MIAGVGEHQLGGEVVALDGVPVSLLVGVVTERVEDMSGRT